MADPSSVANRIREARVRAGRNKNQLARALGTSWQHVDNWEKGKVEPSLASIRRLAELLEVSADFLLGLRADPETAAPNALERFFAELAPEDLTEQEAKWIREAPVDHVNLEPRDYAQLLVDLRGMGQRRAPRSGPRPKVDRAAVEAAIEAAKRRVG
jgi:transcriptional regulator with XRE-family HTH domain